MASIVYTKTDEAPALATCSLLPIIKTFTEPAGITYQSETTHGLGDTIESPTIRSLRFHASEILPSD